MIKYALALSLIAVLGLGGTVAFQHNKVQTLETKNASLERSVQSFKLQAEQAKEARIVEAARVEQFKLRNKELTSTITAILEGDIDDETLDPRIADFINGLRPSSTD